MDAANFIPALKYGHKVGPRNLFNAGGEGLVKTGGNHWFVDGDISVSSEGTSPELAFKTIAEAITAAQAYDVIHVFPKQITDYTGDPTSYSENLIIPFTKAGLRIVGEGSGFSQGGLPQIKVGSTTTDPILKIRAPGCLLTGLGFNGVGGTGGGILLDDNYSTKAAFGTTIQGCHLKNCQGPDVDDATEGGAIQWTTAGNAWQVSILNNRFYKNVADITLMGTSNTRPQDVIVVGNHFSGYAAYTDCNIYGAAGGFGSINIHDNVFGQLPAIGSNVARYMDLTGTLSGMVTRNYFGAQSNTTGGTTMTWLAAGTAAKIPVTVHVAGNWGQGITAGENGSINIGADT